MTERVSPRTNAALERLRRASQYEFDDVLKALLDGGEGLARAVEIVERRIDEGVYVVAQRLLLLIVATRSPSLYAKTKVLLFGAEWELIDLYKSGYPDPDIESRLIEVLYRTATDDADYKRRAIAEAMRDVGTAAVLPTLEAILFDGKPEAQVKRMLADAAAAAEPDGPEALSPGWLLGLEASSRTTFLETVAQAIDAIDARSAAVDEPPPEAGQPPETANDVDDARLKGLRARQFPESPIIATILLRQGAEALCKDAYRLLGRVKVKDAKPARKMTLELLLNDLRNSDLPDVFRIAMQTIQSFGNFAAHDQDGDHVHLTAEIASALQVVYDQAETIYRRWAAARRASDAAG